jgi:hypothetical protein
MHIAAQFLLVPKLWRSHMPLSLYCYALIIIATWWHHCWREGPIKLELQRARPLINYYTNRCSIWQQDMAGPRAQGSPTRWAHPSRTRHMVAAVAARVGPTSQWLQRDGSAQLSSAQLQCQDKLLLCWRSRPGTHSSSTAWKPRKEWGLYFTFLVYSCLC